MSIYPMQMEEGETFFTDQFMPKLAKFYFGASQGLHRAFNEGSLEEGDYCFSLDSDASGDTVSMLVCLPGDKYAQISAAIDSDYPTTAKPFEDLAVKNNYSGQILTNDDDNVVVFEIKI